MWNKIGFYLTYAFNNLRANGRQTLFGLLCIAAGVTAIVSLQTMGEMIKDTFSGNLKESNLADIRILPEPRPGVSADLDQRSELISGEDVFKIEAVDTISTWLEDQFPGATQVTYRQATTGNSGLVVTNPRNEEVSPLTIPFIVDTQRYPLYGLVRSQDGKTLHDLIQQPTDMVVSRKLANQLKAEVGDLLRLNDSTESYTLRGIVPDDVGGGFDERKIAAGMLGFYYLDVRAVEFFSQMPAAADVIYIRLTDPSQLKTINDAILTQYPYLNTITIEDLKDDNSRLSDIINQLVGIMGMISMLIGGIGIVNTMLVVVRRRTEEIAILKTIGVEPTEVTILFLFEALIIGILGSILGVLLGWLAAYLMRDLVGTFITSSLHFKITPAPALTGFFVGVLITTVFGFLPTLAAGQIRPALVLHPREDSIPVAAQFRMFAALIVVLLLLSMLIRGMFGDLSEIGLNITAFSGVFGIALGAGVGIPTTIQDWLSTPRIHFKRLLQWLFWLLGLPALGFLFGYIFPATLLLFIGFAVIALIYAILWGLIWLIGRIASLEMLIDLKIALRSLRVTRGRHASTLLALVIGVFVLSLITLLVTAVRERFVQQLIRETGGNAIIYVTGEEDSLQKGEQLLTQAYGRASYAVVKNYEVDPISITHNGTEVPFADIQQRLIKKYGDDASRLEDLSTTLSEIDARDVTANLPSFPLYSGRALDSSDVGQPVIVIAANDVTLAAGITVGDTITVKPKGSEQLLSFEIVGLSDQRNSLLSGVSAPNYAPLSYFPEDLETSEIRVIMNIPSSDIPTLREQVSNIPGTFLLETRSLNDLLDRVMSQFSSLLVPMAGLALFTGGIVIANAVALSTMERRRDIATMKAVGIGRWRVLGMLLMEYGLMGFLGGVIGVGIGVVILGVILERFFQGQTGSAASLFTMFWLVLLALGISLAAALASAWNASGEKPLNVLRYK